MGSQSEQGGGSQLQRDLGGEYVCEQAKKLPNELVIDGVSLARSSAILSKGFYLSFFVRVLGSDH